VTIKVEWLTPEQCGLPAPPPMTRRPVPLYGTTVHHTATGDPDAHPVETWARIAHEATSGGLAERYSYMPYNAGVCKIGPGLGAILGGRPNGVIGAHAVSTPPFPQDWPNLYTLGVALVGNEPTPEALEALKVFLFIANIGEHAPLVFPHSFWDPTACPGNGVRNWLAGLHNKNVFLHR
jgi:hypothetical protein